MNIKVNIGKSIRKVFSTVLNSLGQLFLFNIIYILIVSLIFKPIIRSLISIFMSIKGYPILINGDIMSFFKSFTGILVGIIALFIASVSAYYEFTNYLYILKYKQQKSKKGIIYIMEKSVYSLKTLKSMDVLLFSIYSIVFLPLFNFGLESTILPSLNIPNFILGEINKYPMGGVLIVLLSIAGFMLAARLLFVFPIMIFEEKSFLKAAKKSFYLTKNSNIRNFVLIALLVIISTAGILLSLFLFIQLRGIIFLPFKIISFLLGIIATATLPVTIIGASFVCYESFVPGFILEDNVHEGEIKSEVINFFKNFKNTIVALFNKYAPKWLVKHSYLLLVFLLIPIIIIGDIYLPIKSNETDTIIVGHRGSLDGAENTKEALFGAINQNADYAEIDILLSKDNVPMVIHDKNLFRLSGSNVNIYDLTAEEISKIKIYSNGYEGYITTLDEVCKLSKDKIKLLVELKTHGMEKKSVVEETIKVIQTNNMENEVLYQSLEIDLLHERNEKFPNIKMGYIIYGYVGNLSKSKILKLKVDFLGIEESFLNSKIVKSCHKAGIPVYAWTINESETLQELHDIKVDGIITDHPEIMRETLEDIKRNIVD